MAWSSLVEGDENQYRPSGKLSWLWNTKKLTNHTQSQIPHKFEHHGTGDPSSEVRQTGVLF